MANKNRITATARQLSVESYYQTIGQRDCDIRTTVGEALSNPVDTAIHYDFRQLKLPFSLPDATESIFDNGKICYMTYEDENDAVSFIQGKAYKITSNLVNRFTNIFLRVQQVSISERPLSQIKQTFDGVYAGVYGGSIARISISGITHLWSGKRAFSVEGKKNNPTNIEIEALHRLMNLVCNMRGGIFNFHDGFRARKWQVIPSSFATIKNVGQNNQEVYEIQFLGASFNQKFGHVESAGGNLQRFSGPTARFPSRNIL